MRDENKDNVKMKLKMAMMLRGSECFCLRRLPKLSPSTQQNVMNGNEGTGRSEMTRGGELSMGREKLA